MLQPCNTSASPVDQLSKTLRNAACKRAVQASATSSSHHLFALLVVTPACNVFGSCMQVLEHVGLNAEDHKQLHAEQQYQFWLKQQEHKQVCAESM
jgi:hypothetical protein